MMEERLDDFFQQKEDSGVSVSVIFVTERLCALCLVC